MELFATFGGDHLQSLRKLFFRKEEVGRKKKEICVLGGCEAEDIFEVTNEVTEAVAFKRRMAPSAPARTWTYWPYPLGA